MIQLRDCGGSGIGIGFGGILWNISIVLTREPEGILYCILQGPVWVPDLGEAKGRAVSQPRPSKIP